MHAQHPTDAHGVEPPVVNQAANGFGVDTELPRYFADAVEAIWVRID